MIKRATRITFTIYIGLILAFASSSCSDRGRTAKNTPAPAKYPKRIVSLSPGTTEILFALGLDKEIVGNTNYCDFPAAAKSKPKVGGLYDLNFETIMRLNPDLVIMTPTLSDTSKELGRLGYKSMIVNNETFADVLGSISAIGAAVGKTAEAEKLVADMKKEFDAAKSSRGDAPPVRTMIVVDRNPGAIQGIYVAGKGTYFTELLEVAGGKNIFDDATMTYPQPSLEEIIARNPEIIIETRLGDPLAEQDVRRTINEWSALGDIDAVRNKRIYIWTEDYVARPGPRFVLLLRKFQRVIDAEK